MGNERRARKLIDIGLRVMLDMRGVQTIFFESHDISMSGIYLETDHPFPVGAEGEIAIKMEFGNEQLLFTSQAAVTNSFTVSSENKPPGMSLAFSNMDTESSIILYNIIKYQESTKILDSPGS